jgi:hypothetical protein
LFKEIERIKEELKMRIVLNNGDVYEDAFIKDDMLYAYDEAICDYVCLGCADMEGWEELK